eukprot:g1843.t1
MDLLEEDWPVDYEKSAPNTPTMNVARVGKLFGGLALGDSQDHIKQENFKSSHPVAVNIPKITNLDGYARREDPLDSPFKREDDFQLWDPDGWESDIPGIDASDSPPLMPHYNFFNEDVNETHQPHTWTAGAPPMLASGPNKQTASTPHSNGKPMANIPWNTEPYVPRSEPRPIPSHASSNPIPIPAPSSSRSHASHTSSSTEFVPSNPEYDYDTPIYGSAREHGSQSVRNSPHPLVHKSSSLPTQGLHARSLPVPPLKMGSPPVQHHQVSRSVGRNSPIHSQLRGTPPGLNVPQLGGEEGDDDKITCGEYTKAERRRKVQRYREKREKRTYQKKIMYECRKSFADKRPRVGGRFVKVVPPAAQAPASPAQFATAPIAIPNGNMNGAQRNGIPPPLVPGLSASVPLTRSF